MMHVWNTVMVLLGANKTFIFASFGQLCINAIVFFFWPELAFFQRKTDNHCVAVFASEWEFRQVKTLPELHDCCTWMYILLKTGFSTVLKLTYIQESLKMHGIYAERQCSTFNKNTICSLLRNQVTQRFHSNFFYISNLYTYC